MKQIELTQGFAALVDDCDYDRVTQFRWHVQKRGKRLYAARNVLRLDGRRGLQYLHRFLMQEALHDIDHVNGNGLDNQRANLRSATRTENSRGFCRKKENTTSKYRGVSWDSRIRKWIGRIRLSPTHAPIVARSDSEEEAARAYDAAASEHFGEFAQLNFV